MIEMIEGRPGSYKSYTAVTRAVNHFMRGGLVATNLDLNIPAIKKYIDKRGLVFHDEQCILLNSDQVREFPKYTPRGTLDLPVLIIIEEAGRFFNARDWAKVGRGLLDYLALSRHEHNDVIFVDQAVENVDKQFRRLVQYIWRCRDWQKRMKCWPFPHYYVAQIDYDGKTVLDWKLHHKRKDIYKLYNSFSRSVVRMDRFETEKTRFDVKKKGGRLCDLVSLLC